MDLAVEVPAGRARAGRVATRCGQEIYDRLADADPAAPHDARLRQHAAAGRARRASSGRAARRGRVLAHHGSLSRKTAARRRRAAEGRRAARGRRDGVARARHRHRLGRSRLPDRIAAIDRGGAAAHRPLGPLASARPSPKGRLFATTRDELIECAALVRAIRAGELDRLHGARRRRSTSWRSRSSRMAAAEDWRRRRAVRRSCAAPIPTASLPRRDFDAVIEMLSEGIATARGRSGAYLHRDRGQRTSCAAGAARGSRRSPPAARFRTPRSYPVVAEPEGNGRRHARRGLRRREPGRRRLPARHDVVAHPPRRGGPGARRRCARRGAHDSVLARRSAGAHRRALAARSSRICGQRIAGSDARRRPSSCSMPRVRARPRGAEQAVVYVRAGAAALGALPDAATPSSPSGSSTKAAACSSSCTRRSARASTGPGAWRCASASAARSTSSCRPRPPTTASSSRSASSTAFRSRSSSSS